MTPRTTPHLIRRAASRATRRLLPHSLRVQLLPRLPGQGAGATLPVAEKRGALEGCWEIQGPFSVSRATAPRLRLANLNCKNKFSRNH